VRPALVGAALLVAGCGEGGGDPAPESSPLAAVTPAPPAAPSRQVGQVSALSGATSGLTGQVSGFAVSVTDTATVVQLAADTLFAFDKADLDSAAQANLQRTADLVRQGGTGEVAVVGHTDAKGDDAYNLDLSRRRAAAVATWFRTQPGLAARTFVPEGKGETAPVAPNARPDGGDDPDGRARNRRVEVVIPRA